MSITGSTVGEDSRGIKHLSAEATHVVSSGHLLHSLVSSLKRLSQEIHSAPVKKGVYSGQTTSVSVGEGADPTILSAAEGFEEVGEF